MTTPHEPIASAEQAATSGLQTAIDLLLPALETFTRFEEADSTAREHTVWSAQLDEPVPQEGIGMEATLERLRDTVIPHGIRNGAPGFCGWVTTAPTTVPAVSLLAAAIAGSQREWRHAFNEVEAVALRWLAELVGLPSSYQGIFTSGGAMANLLGVAAARQYTAEQRGIDPAQQGVAGLPSPRVYTSTEAHAVIHRAAAILGLGRDAVVTLPTTAHFQLDVIALRERLQADRQAGCTPIAVVASTGTVNTGAVDPIAELGVLCREEGIWLHVDGAYGLLGILDERVADLYGDLTAASSLVIDPHKWLAASIGCGAVFVRDRTLLARAFAFTSAAYMQLTAPPTELTSPFDSWGHTYGELGLESSSPSRGAQVWAILKEIGVKGVQARICRHNDYARVLADLVQASSCLQLMAPVTLSICCFRYAPPPLQGRTDEAVTTLLNTLNRDILQRVRARGRCIPSSTIIRGAFVLRACFINPRTTLADVSALIHEVETCGAAAWASAIGEESTQQAGATQG